jgi:nitroreductase
MIRHYITEPVADDTLDRILTAGLRAPSAGYSQGYALLVLRSSAERDRFWQVTETEPQTASWPETVRLGIRQAPVLIVVLSCKRVYLDRYAQPDKGWTDRDEARWPVPFWHIDAGFVALLLQLAAIDEGLGSLFFGVVPERLAALRAEFGIPADHDPIGVVAIGHPDPAAPRRDLRARRRSAEELIHYGRW